MTSGGPTGDGIEHRVSALERSFETINSKLDKLVESVGDLRVGIARIEERLEHKASASEVAAIKGRVDALPTTWQMIALVFSILGGTFSTLEFGLAHTP